MWAVAVSVNRGALQQVRLVGLHPVALGLYPDEHEEAAAEEVGDEDEDQERADEADDGAEHAEVGALLHPVEAVDEARGADELEHADDLHGAEVVGLALGVGAEDGGDDGVEGEAAGEVGEEPAPEVVDGDLAHVVDQEALRVGVGGDEGEPDVDHEDDVDGELGHVGCAGDARWRGLKRKIKRDVEGAIHQY